MGQQCCSSLGQDQPYIKKLLLLNQNEFYPISDQQFNKNEPLLRQKVANIDQLKVYKHLHQDKFFLGEWVNGQAMGQAALYVPGKILYKGSFNDGRPSGQGQMNFLSKNQQYKGNFVDGKANGQGRYQNLQKQFTFQGEWNNSQPYKGTLKFENNPNIQKIQLKDFTVGLAQILYKDGRKYEGLIDQQKFTPQGQGKITFTDGSTYGGGWKNGLMHGNGIYQWKDGSKYEGSYNQGKKQGSGVFYYSAGKRYIGNWNHGKQQGHGKIITKQGIIQKDGIWTDGKFDKPIIESDIQDLPMSNNSSNRKQIN